MEVTVLKGRASALRHFADHVIAERSARHGRFVVLPSQAGTTLEAGKVEALPQTPPKAGLWNLVLK